MSDMTNLQPLTDPARDLRRQFDEMTAPHRRALWAFCLRLTGNVWDAEDLVQESMLKAFARLSLSWQPLEPRAYLFRIAANAWVDAWRRRGAGLSLDDLGQEPAAAPPADPLDTHDALGLVVLRLSPPQRVVFLLTEAFSFTHEEVAGMLGLTVGAVKALRYRARRALDAPPPPDAAPAVRAADPEIVRRYVDAFNRRDVGAIVALLAPEAVNDIVGVAEERGAEAMREASLSEWAADPRRTRAEVRLVFGREVVLVFQEDQAGRDALAWLVDLEVREGAVRAQRLYCFCPELLEAVGADLGLPVNTRGYWYEPADA